MNPMLVPVARNRPVGRFAPSPTGTLHIGNLRTALEARAHADAHGALFILRIEDTDLPRNVPGATEQILHDLQWLGITWDEGPDIGGPAGPYRQSVRTPVYEAALRELARRGMLYPCTCSRRDLRSAASAPHGIDGPQYPGTCRDKAPATGETRWLDDLLQAPPGTMLAASVRLRVDLLEPVQWTDERGHHQVNINHECGDFVLLRRDALWAYQFCCAVDDALMGITHVVRGEDLRTSAPRQAAVMAAFDWPIPRYHHLPLVAAPDGTRMAKRDASTGITHLSSQGLTPDQAKQVILNQPLITPTEPDTANLNVPDRPR